MYSDPDSFAAAWATSSAFLPAEIDTSLFEQFRTLWHIANDSFKDLLKLMGLNQSQCSARFCIPLRTVQDWAGERRGCLPYIRLMMAEAVGLVNLRG